MPIRPPLKELNIKTHNKGFYKGFNRSVHTIMNCTQSCPKGLNPAKAIAEIKKMMVERRI